MKIAVLGAGRVGGAIAADLAAHAEFEVTAADRSAEALGRLGAGAVARTVVADLADPARVHELALEHDLVVGAVPARLGYRALEAAIDAGRHVVDISFFEEDALGLDGLARERGVVAVVDAGVSPGLSNIILGYQEAVAEQVSRYACYVGGLPADRGGLFQYKAPFSPADVIEVYTRPARYKAGGEIFTDPALSRVEEIEVPGIGTLEALLTDGLRTLLSDDAVPEMRELTLRYPGHAGQMRLLRDMGLFDTTPVELDGVQVSPRELTTRLLFPLWEFGPGEADLTALRVEVDTETAGRKERHVYDMLDRYDRATDTSSMARTTGYTCTAIVQLVTGGGYRHVGISPPEFVGREPTCFEWIMRYLEERGVLVTHSVELVEEAT